MARGEDREALSAELLLRAYAAGVFPMAEDAASDELLWIDPDLRGVIPLEAFHIPRSLARVMKRGGYQITIDEDFAGVVNGCADRSSTWINDDIRRLYMELHGHGHAHSVEYRVSGRLLGGLYGVRLGAAFFGESMFSAAPEASKVALVHLVARLKAGGFMLLDTQFNTDHLARFGAISIPRAKYRATLDAALRRSADFFVFDGDASVQDVMQVSTQTS